MPTKPNHRTRRPTFWIWAERYSCSTRFRQNSFGFYVSMFLCFKETLLQTDENGQAALGLECGSWEKGCVGAYGSKAGTSRQGCDGIHPRGGTHKSARHGELGAMRKHTCNLLLLLVYGSGVRECLLGDSRHTGGLGAGGTRAVTHECGLNGSRILRSSRVRFEWKVATGVGASSGAL